MNMHQVFLLFDRWNGLLISLGGVYVSLLAYKVLPISSSSELSENWHNKYGALMRTLGPVSIVAGMGSLLFFS